MNLIRVNAMIIFRDDDALAHGIAYRMRNRAFFSRELSVSSAASRATIARKVSKRSAADGGGSIVIK